MAMIHASCGNLICIFTVLDQVAIYFEFEEVGWLFYLHNIYVPYEKQLKLSYVEYKTDLQLKSTFCKLCIILLILCSFFFSDRQTT